MIIKPGSSKKWEPFFPHQCVRRLKSHPLPRVVWHTERTGHRKRRVDKGLPGNTILLLNVDCPGAVPQRTPSSSAFPSHTFSPAQRTPQALFLEVINEPEGCSAEPCKIN